MDPTTHNTLIMIGLCAIAALGWMSRWQEPACDQCSHCANKARRRAQEFEQRRHDEMHDMPFGNCPKCNPREDK